MTRQPIPATLIPGDGIGPEVTDAALAVFEGLGVAFDWDVRKAGQSAMDELGEQLPADTIASIRKTGLALKGPLATPVGGGFRSVNVALRQEFELYANVRPVRTLVPGRYDNVDIVLVRENLEGFYVGAEHYVRVGDDPHAVGVATGFNTRVGSKRLFEYSFALAERLGRKKVTIVHKANILKILTGVFLEAGREAGKAYEGRLTVEDQIVDACAMNLILNPQRFDMIVTTNMFGDILSDLIAGLVGGLGMAPSGNIGAKAAIFEAVHGSAPDIAGKNLANPLALIMAAGMMLDHVGLTDEAARLRRAIDRALADGQKTRDIGGTLGTSEMAKAIVARLGD
jgi:isocitrate dehydrogenase (NAD+)